MTTTADLQKQYRDTVDTIAEALERARALGAVLLDLRSSAESATLRSDAGIPARAGDALVQIARGWPAGARVEDLTLGEQAALLAAFIL